MSIALSLGNNLTTNGVFKADAVNNTSVNNVTDFASITGDATLVLLSTQTASASASISFTSGIDSTYDEYIFKFINIHPATSNTIFEFNLSTDGGSNYNVTKTTTFFTARHREDDSAATLTYQTSFDLAQSTSYQTMFFDSGNNNDDGSSGEFYLFNPSSTTYVKNFFSRFNSTNITPQIYDNYCAGYGNTTSAINAIDFKFSSGNIDDGIIKMYGVAKS